MKELLHFTATWCQPCKQMAPVIENFLANNLDIKYTKIDADESPSLFAENQITGVPAFVSKVDGEDYKFHKGVATEDKLTSLFA